MGKNLEAPETSNRFEKRSEEIRRVVRMVCVAPRRLEDLETALAIGQSINDVFSTEVVLAQKSNKSEVSAGKVMPLGGGIHPGESVLEAALREGCEESMLLTMSRLQTEAYNKRSIPGVQYRHGKKVSEAYF